MLESGRAKFAKWGKSLTNKILKKRKKNFLVSAHSNCHLLQHCVYTAQQRRIPDPTQSACQDAYRAFSLTLNERERNESGGVAVISLKTPERRLSKSVSQCLLTRKTEDNRVRDRQKDIQIDKEKGQGERENSRKAKPSSLLFSDYVQVRPTCTMATDTSRKGATNTRPPRLLSFDTHFQFFARFQLTDNSSPVR